MFDGIKPIHVGVAAGAAAITFGLGVFFMLGDTAQSMPLPSHASTTPDRAIVPTAVPPKKPVNPVPSAVDARPAKKPTGAAARVAVLKLFGQAEDVSVTTRYSGLRDSKINQLVHEAENLRFHDIYPDAIEMARRLKASPRSEYLVITPTNLVSMDQIIGLLGEPNSSQADTGTARSERLTWHHYSWLDFGAIGGKVVTVRLNCPMTPNFGL